MMRWLKSKDTRKKIADWFLKAVLPVKSKKGVFIVTGTILDNDSLLKNIALNKYRIISHGVFYGIRRYMRMRTEIKKSVMGRYAPCC